MGQEHLSGHWECIRCYGRDVYESSEVTGAIAGTISTPGPVNPTFINSVTSKVTRCRSCGEKAKWIASPEAIEAKRRRQQVQKGWIGKVFGVIFALMSIGVFFTLGGVGIVISIICAILSLVFFMVGMVSAQMQKLDSEEEDSKSSS